MKTIKLTQGRVAIVDEQDYDELIKMKWYLSYNAGHYYACHNNYKDGKKTRILMHRYIAKAGKDVIVKHYNGDTLFNVRMNLILMRGFETVPLESREWLSKPSSEILMLPEPELNYSFFPKECHCGQIFYMDLIPNHICKPQLKTA